MGLVITAPSATSGGAGNFTLIEEKTLAVDATTMVFSAIPAYDNYYLTGQWFGTVSTYGYLRLNADTGANYGWQNLVANGAVISASNASATTHMIQGPLDDTVLSEVNISISNQAAYRKTISSTCGCRLESYWSSGEWRNTADLITSITLFTGGGDFKAGTSISLFGLG